MALLWQNWSTSSWAWFINMLPYTVICCLQAQCMDIIVIQCSVSMGAMHLVRLCLMAECGLSYFCLYTVICFLQAQCLCLIVCLWHIALRLVWSEGSVDPLAPIRGMHTIYICCLFFIILLSCVILICYVCIMSLPSDWFCYTCMSISIYQLSIHLVFCVCAWIEPISFW